MPKNSTLNFEQSLESLEEIVEQLEDGDLSLEDALKAFEKGIKLTRQCQTALTKAEQKIQILLEENDDLSAHDFPENLDDAE
ncbi:MAG: exodeoxyribonuclease VII small subunit [Pseudomonadota bacterium]